MNRILFKKIVLALILTLCLGLLSGCYNEHYIDKLAYVVAIGIDVGESNNYRLTLQISIPSSETSEGNGSSQSSNVVIKTVNCSSINSGINLIDNYISKKINLSHCKVIIFSEEIAASGISEILYSLINNIEMRSTTNVIISKCPAKDFIENSKPTLEKLTARYYEIIPTSSKYTAFIEDIDLGDFFSNLTDSTTQPYAILGNISNSISNDSSDNEFVAGEAPITNKKTNIENMGLAVFLDDKLVGELTNLECVSHLIITSKLQSCVLSIPNAENVDSNLDLKVKLNKNTKCDVDISGSSPFITTNINLECEILTMNSNSKYLSEEIIRKVEESTNSYVKSIVEEYLNKTAKEFGSDISGFGGIAIRKFLTTSDWEKYNWNANYKNSVFKVNVSTHVKSAELLLNT